MRISDGKIRVVASVQEYVPIKCPQCDTPKPFVRATLAHVRYYECSRPGCAVRFKVPVSDEPTSPAPAA